MRSVEGRPDRELVISLGGRLRPSDLGPLPERVHAFEWVPQLDVLRRTDAVVTHGGSNTIDECVLAGVPMLIYCGYQTDMAGNTVRVAHHGLGLAGEARDGVREIRGRLDRLLGDGLLGDGGFLERVERMRGHYRAYVDGRVLERTVDELLAEARPRTGGGAT